MRRTILYSLGSDLTPLTQPVPLVEDRFFTGIQNCFQYVVQEDDTILTVSLKAYNTSNYWTIIAEQNKLSDPLELTVGQVLNVPFLTAFLDL